MRGVPSGAWPGRRAASAARRRPHIPWRHARRRGRLHDVLTVAPDALRPWFTPELPGPLVFEHVARTGHGRVRVGPLARPAGGGRRAARQPALRGDPDHLPPKELATLAGFVEAPPEWLPALRASDPRTGVWDRLVAVLPATAAVPPPTADVRLLTRPTRPRSPISAPSSAWIAETLGRRRPGCSKPAWRGACWWTGRCAALAVPFYLGGRYEDIGVVTEPAHRGRGLSVACAGADRRHPGPRPRTDLVDVAGQHRSRGVAARLGFVHERDDASTRCARRSRRAKSSGGHAGSPPPPPTRGRAPRAWRRCAAGAS